MIPIFRPEMNKEEILKELEKIFDSGWIGLGPKTSEFEEKFARYVGAKYAIGISSCTAALHLSFHSLGIKEGDEVIIPSFTFASTIIPLLYQKAIPVFADILPDTLCMDPLDIKRKITNRTKAIVVVHLGGHSAPMDEIWDIAKSHNLFVIEDAAHACGSEYKGKKHGGLPDTKITCFSFHAVKNLTTGDGGMITTEDTKLYEKLKRLRWLDINKSTWDRIATGSYPWEYRIDELGFKYHMNDIAAVIGLAQLKVLDKHNQRRRAITQKYNEELGNLDWMEIPVEREYTKSSNHMYIIKTEFRNELHEYLIGRGIQTTVHYEPAHHYKVFKDFPAQVPVTERIWKKLLTLPLYPSMKDEEVEKVIDEIQEFGKTKI